MKNCFTSLTLIYVLQHLQQKVNSKLFKTLKQQFIENIWWIRLFLERLSPKQPSMYVKYC